MDFIEALSGEILEKVVPAIAEAVRREVTSQIKEEIILQYSEEEAAGKLNITTAQLANIRKNKEIEFSYTMLPTMGKDNKLHNGRVAYTPQHLADFLKRREQKQFFGNLRAA